MTDKVVISDAMAAHLKTAKHLTETLVNEGVADPGRLQYQLTKPSRQELAKQLKASGMSTRAIAKQLSVHHSTIEADLGGKSAKKGGKSATKKKHASRKAEDFEGCNTPDFGPEPENVEEMSNDEVAQHHVRYCVAQARDMVDVIRNEIRKAGNQAITQEMIDSSKEVARLFTVLAADYTKRRKEISHARKEANGRSTRSQSDEIRNREA